MEETGTSESCGFNVLHHINTKGSQRPLKVAMGENIIAAAQTSEQKKKPELIQSSIQESAKARDSTTKAAPNPTLSPLSLGLVLAVLLAVVLVLVVLIIGAFISLLGVHHTFEELRPSPPSRLHPTSCRRCKWHCP